MPMHAKLDDRPYSRSLRGYLFGPRDRRPFRLGDWIATLDDGALLTLQALSAAAHGEGGMPRPAIDDLLAVVCQALANELGVGSQAMSIQPETEFCVTLGPAALARIPAKGEPRPWSLH